MASKFWVGGGTNTNWNSSPVTNWANTSGGAGNQTAPATGDDVTFDNASGTGASVWNTTVSLNSLICTASRNLVTHSASVTITISGGNLALPGGVGATYTASAITSLLTLTGTTGTQNITSNGKNLGALTLQGVGGTFQLQDNLNCSAVANTSVITLTNGTFDCQTFTVATPQFSSNNANTRVLKGSGTWTLTNTTAVTVWNVTATMTVTNFTSAIVLAGANSNVRTFAGAGLTYSGGLTINANSSQGLTAISGSNTFGTLAIAAPNGIQWASGTTNVISAAFTLSGSSGSEIFHISSSNTATATLSVAAGSPSFSWSALRLIACSGGATFTATSSFDLGGNSGVTITAPADGGPVGHQCM